MMATVLKGKISMSKVVHQQGDKVMDEVEEGVAYEGVGRQDK